MKETVAAAVTDTWHSLAGVSAGVLLIAIVLHLGKILAEARGGTALSRMPICRGPSGSGPPAAPSWARSART